MISIIKILYIQMVNQIELNVKVHKMANSKIINLFYLMLITRQISKII